MLLRYQIIFYNFLIDVILYIRKTVIDNRRTGSMLRKLFNLSFISFSIRKFCTKKPSVGFIGMGNMGSILVEKLLKNGIEVHGYDRSKLRRDKMRKMGTIISFPHDIALNNDIIFTLLPDYNAICTICEGEKGIVSSAKKDLLLCDLSTIGPVNAVRLEQALGDKGIEFLSAPISGGTHHDIIFLVGGEPKNMKRVEPFMKKMSQEKEQFIFHIGDDISDGQAARACNILLLASSMIATAEVMNLGIRLGLDPKKLVNGLNSSSAKCWCCQCNNPVPGVMSDPRAPSNNEYNHGESVKIILKSLQIAQDVASRINAPIPLGGLATQMYYIAKSRGFGNKDFSVIFRLVKQTLLKEQ